MTSFVYKPLIYQRKSDGRWVGTINLPHEKGERNRLAPVYGNSEGEIWGKINPILFELQMGTYITPCKSTFVSYLMDYHKICAGYDMWNKDAVRPSETNWAQTTAELYKLYIDVHFTPYFKEVKLVDILPMTLDKFYNYKMSTPRKYTIMVKGKPVERDADPLVLNSVLKLNSFISSAFDYAIANDMAKSNPTQKTKLGKKVKYKPKVFNEDQFMKLLDAIEGTDDEIPIILGGGCGLRRGEIFGLYWRNIDLQTGYITIERTLVRFSKSLEKNPKNESSERTFRAPKYVIDILSEYKKKSKNVLNGRVITKWLPTSYSGRYSILLKKFDLPHTRLHDLRHYNAVIMCKYGTTDKVAAERLGHSQVSTLRNVYQHVLKDMDQTSADGIDEMFSKKKEHDENKTSLQVVS